MIEIQDLSFGYNKQPLCIRDFNLKVKNGEKVVLLGGDGMGKTSLLKVVCGLEKKYFGSVKIDGVDLKSLDNQSKNITYLPTEPILINSTILKNLEFLFKVENIKLSEEEILKVFKKFDFNHDLKTKIKKLSLCDKRIFAIIRAYIKNAKNVLIDNQFLMLEEKMIIKIKNAINLLLNENSDNKTFILVDFLDLDCFDKIVYFSFSKSVCVNNFKDLLINPPDYFMIKYANFFVKDALIYNKSDGVYLYDCDFIYDKKRKKESFNVKNVVKFDKNGVEFAKNEFLNLDGYIKVKLVSVEEFSDISDKEFNVELNKKIFLFDALTGERLF